MGENRDFWKSKKVEMWLRCGYIFLQKAEVGYDLAWNDVEWLTEFIHRHLPPVSFHRRSADWENM
jgi:hypothetical protein